MSSDSPGELPPFLAGTKPTVHLSHDVQQTLGIAAKLAHSLHPGACIALSGDLGAGKTQFVRGLVHGLGGDGRDVSSPTFVLLNVYPSGRLTVYHLDAYRVHGEEDFEQIGFEELLEQDAIVVVEWPQRVAGLIPPSAIHVQLIPTGPTRREIRVFHPPLAPNRG